MYRHRNSKPCRFKNHTARQKGLFSSFFHSCFLWAFSAFSILCYYPKKQTNRVKSSFSFVEILSAFFLLSILTTVFFGFFTSINKAEKSLQKTKEALLQRQYFQINLSQIFSSLKEETPFLPEKNSATKTPPLFFSYQGQIDPDPNFSGELFGKITLEEKNLLLSLLSKDQKKIRKELLLQKVKECKILFLQQKESLFVWKTPIEREDFLTFFAVKMICFPEKGEPVTFVFFPQQKKPKISYQKDIL